MRIITTVVLLFGLAAACFAEGAAPTKEGLLQAWEEIQKADPETVRFEKEGEGTYRFATKQFPFDGKLKVLNTAVRRWPGYGGGKETWMGVVEVELVGAKPDFIQKHAMSYGFWSQNNSLMYDAAAAKWVPMQDYVQTVSESVCGPCAPPCGVVTWLARNTWLIILVVVLLMLWSVSRRAKSQFARAMEANDKLLADRERIMKMQERALELTEESNRVLKEIRDGLKGKG